jgi:uncharacterized damage-inducible protein DinB
MRRLTGAGAEEREHPIKLNTIMFDDLQSLRSARELEDERIVQAIARFDESDFSGNWEYKTLTGTPQSQPLAEILSHIFNHQAHHRGQAHTILTVLGVVEPEPWDLLIMLRAEQG